MLLLDNSAGPVRRKVVSTDEDDREEKRDGPASDDVEYGRCDPGKYWSRCLGKDTSV